MNWKRLVADGYDAIAERLASHEYPTEHVRRWLDDIAASLDPGARVLDLGCGSGVPHTAWLAQRFDVIGVDISRHQLAIARRRVPSAQFVQADMSSLHFPPSHFDAVVAIYSIIHVPRNEQLPLLKAIRSWLRPSGRALVVLGGGDSPVGIEQDWFGAPMYWSHYDAEKSLALLVQAGFRVLNADVEKDTLDGDGGHLFALCLKE